jgi:hypothetical protein
LGGGRFFLGSAFNIWPIVKGCELANDEDNQVYLSYRIGERLPRGWD